MNDITRMIPIVGKCPFCQGQLYFNGTYLYCEHGDYKADPIAFDQIWFDFSITQIKTEEDKDFDYASGDKLLDDLRALHDQPIPIRPSGYGLSDCIFLMCPCPSICHAVGDQCHHKDPAKK
jgi:hypothetical protein